VIGKEVPNTMPSIGPVELLFVLVVVVVLALIVRAIIR
jgi:hypothetical protein